MEKNFTVFVAFVFPNNVVSQRLISNSQEFELVFNNFLRILQDLHLLYGRENIT